MYHKDTEQMREGDYVNDSLLDFEDFFNSTYAAMLNYCKSRGQKHADADEIVAEAFTRMWRVWDRYADSDTARCKKWLYNAVNYIILEKRNKSGPPERDIGDYMDSLINEAGDELTAVFEGYKYDIYIDRVRKILTKTEWKWFELIVIEGLTYREAADKLGKSVDNAYVQMTKIRGKIDKSRNDLFK